MTKFRNLDDAFLEVTRDPRARLTLARQGATQPVAIPRLDESRVPSLQHHQYSPWVTPSSCLMRSDVHDEATVDAQEALVSRRDSSVFIGPRRSRCESLPTCNST
mgnify:CR=1 FL=1